MTGADWIIIGTIFLSVLLAVSQGFFYEIFSLAGVIVGYLLAVWEYARIAKWFLPYTTAGWVAEIAGFFIVFLVVVFTAGLIGRVARWMMREAGLRWFDRLLGAGFGLARGVLIVTIVVLALASFTPGSRFLANSRLGPYFLVIARGASWVAPSGVRARFRQGVETLRNFSHPQGRLRYFAVTAASQQI